jgi:hypothetical protein
MKDFIPQTLSKLVYSLAVARIYIYPEMHRLITEKLCCLNLDFNSYRQIFLYNQLMRIYSRFDLVFEISTNATAPQTHLSDFEMLIFSKIGSMPTPLYWCSEILSYVSFYIHSKKLIIQIDDQNKTEDYILYHSGYKILRFNQTQWEEMTDWQRSNVINYIIG